MKFRTIIAYICIPGIFALTVFSYDIYSHSLDFGLLIQALILRFFFYIAPYLLWAGVISLGKFSNFIAHAGFIGATFALLLTASMWFIPGDPSGLPLQWIVYWPLAVIVELIFAFIAKVYLYIDAA